MIPLFRSYNLPLLNIIIARQCHAHRNRKQKINHVRICSYFYIPDIIPIRGSITDSRIMPTIIDSMITIVGSIVASILFMRVSISS